MSHNHHQAIALAPSPARSEAATLPELLAPAGNWECAKAAVENGADAIYFGLDRFNARIRAHNFTVADLPRLMAFLHRRGVRGYVSFNTLIFENEMAEAEQVLRTVIAAGVDGALVQDVGICRLLRQLSPDFPIHASTQMTITSAAGVAFARELGCQRVVLARECSIREVERIRSEFQVASSKWGPGPGAERESRETTVVAADGADNPEPGTRNSELPPPELEVFVHGALCVAYSGQCLTSEALGGRSANRGECAQACRMPYELIADGQPVPLGDRRYLLSPQDLAGLELLPDLVGAGVASVKIEGRLKTPEYVANITRIYRQALDRIGSEFRGAGAELETSRTAGPLGTGNSELETSRGRYDMEMAFSRGLYTGWLRGVNNQALVHGRFGTKRGVYLGEVRRVQGDRVFVQLAGPLKPGDGVVFDAGNPQDKEEGGRVYEVQSSKLQVQGGVEVALAFGRGDIDFSRIRPGHKLWKTSDPELDRRLRQTFAGETPQFQRPVSMAVHGLAGQPMTLILRDEDGHVAQVSSQAPLVEAVKQPLGTERLREQLGRLGGTPFRLGRFENRLAGAVILPVSELNRMRREAVARLEELRAAPKRWTLLRCEFRVSGSELAEAAADPRYNSEPGTRNSELIVLVRSLPQLEAALECGVRSVYCDFEDPKKYREAVARVRSGASTGEVARPEIWVAPPRIFKPGEDWTLKQARSCEADGYLVRNYDHLKVFAGDRRRGDFSLNVANARAAEFFQRRFGLERLTASYDLNATQLEALLRAAPPEWFEVTIHQHMPMFHMEHCVFCAFLSQGTDYTNCGRPCDSRKVKLRDRVGVEHPVRADVGCRNTVFNGLAQTGAEYVARFQELGVRHFRVEFVDETPAQVADIIAKYRQLLEGTISGGQLWRELKLQHQLGVTRGPLDKR
jgi:putative protease